MSPEHQWLEDVFSYWNSPFFGKEFVQFQGCNVFFRDPFQKDTLIYIYIWHIIYIYILFLEPQWPLFLKVNLQTKPKLQGIGMLQHPGSPAIISDDVITFLGGRGSQQPWFFAGFGGGWSCGWSFRGGWFFSGFLLVANSKFKTYLLWNLT